MTENRNQEELEALFDKKYTCPVCENKFTARQLRTGKCKLVDTDPDLRPKYQGIDSLKYDAAMCPQCGYAFLKKFFIEEMTPLKIKNITENVTANYKGGAPLGETLSYDEAIRLHKLALVSSMAIQSDFSEQAYTCLKIAWLCRSKREFLEAEGDDTSQTFLEEENFIKKAYAGFRKAYTMEEFPICGMDEATFSYLIAILAFESEQYKEVGQWLTKVFGSRDASDRVKEKARDLKEKMKQVDLEQE